MPTAHPKVTQSCKPGVRDAKFMKMATAQEFKLCTQEVLFGCRQGTRHCVGTTAKGHRKRPPGAHNTDVERRLRDDGAEGGCLAGRPGRETLVREQQGDCKGAEESSYLFQCEDLI